MDSEDILNHIYNLNDSTDDEAKPADINKSLRTHTPSVTPQKLKTGNRYFSQVDISVVCFHCSQVGHMSRECPNPKKMTCFLCARVGHEANDCPFSSDEDKRNKTRVSKALSCFWCASNDHHFTTCPKFSLKSTNPLLNCFLCGKQGQPVCCSHIPAQRKPTGVSCPGCSRNHSVRSCPEINYRFLVPPLELKGFISGKSSLKCSRCEFAGHLSYDCKEYTQHILSHVKGKRKKRASGKERHGDSEGGKRKRRTSSREYDGRKKKRK